MSVWQIEFTPEANNDFISLDHSQQVPVAKAIKRVAQNPLPATEGGYGKPLKGRLANTLKIKLRKEGLRVVYTLKREANVMRVIVISIREDNVVYKIAEQRIRSDRQ